MSNRVTQAESSITQNANSITQKVSSIDVENILTGKSYATQSQLAQTSNSLTSTISSVKSDLDNMVIGGTNILATTTEDKTFQGNGAENQLAILFLLTKSSLADYNLKVGDKVSFSATCEISGSNFSGILTPRLRTAWTNLTSNYGAYTITKAEKIYFKSTFVVTESRLENGTGVDFRADNVPSTVNMKWSNLKLEIGDKVTYYSPAPEEKASQIQVTQMAQDLDGFKTTVANTYTDKSTVASQINQSATQVTQNVQSWTNGKLNSYSTIQSTDSSIALAVADKVTKAQFTVLSNQMTSTISQLNAENLNFILNGSFQTTENWDYSSGTTINATTTNGSAIPIAAGSYLRAINSNDSYVVSQNASTNVINSLKGKTVTFSGYAKCLSGSSSTFRLYVKVTASDGSVSYFGSGVDQTITTAWTRYSMTATFPNDTTDISWTYNFRGLANVYTYLTGAMTNIGSVLMPYVDSTLSYANQSQITQLASDINLRVTKNYVVNQINLSNEGVLISANKLTLETTGNLICNSEFQSNNVLDGWTQKSNGITRNFGISSSFYTDKQGAASNYIVIDTSSDNVTTDNWKTFGQTFRSRENNPWSFSAIVNMNLRGTDAPGSYKLQIIFLDDNDEVLLYANSSIISDTGINTVKIENAVSPAGTVKIEARLVVYGQARVYSTRYMLNYGRICASYSASAGNIYVVGNMIVDGAVTADAIATGAITTAKLAAGAVTADKITVNNLAALSSNIGTITAGIINAANMNIINLNARALTAGTINGSNLSMNLDDGEVQFTKGFIEGAGGGIRLDMNQNYLQSLNDQGDGFIVKNGIFEFYSSFMTAQKNKMGTLSLDIINDGILFRGKKRFTIATDNFEGRLSVNTSDITASGKMVSLIGNGGKASIDIGGGFGGANGIGLIGNSGFMGNLSVTGSKNAVHVTRDGTRATPAYETAESYLGDIGWNYTRENYEIWVEIYELFSDTVNTDIAYEIFLQAYDDARFWVSDFRSDKFLVKSDKPMSRFAWELKAKRRGYENERLVLQESFDNKMLLDAHAEGAF